MDLGALRRDHKDDEAPETEESAGQEAYEMDVEGHIVSRI
jgi:hypothetical protein